MNLYDSDNNRKDTEEDDLNISSFSDPSQAEDDRFISSFSNPEETETLSAPGKKSKRDEKRKKKKEKKYKSTFHKVMSKIGMVFLTVFLVGVITCSILGATLAVYIIGFSDSKVNFDLNTLDLQFTTIVYANGPDGEPVELERLQSSANREWIDIVDIPKQLQNAFVAIEDQRYKSHAGVDWKRTFGAFGNYIFHYWPSQQGGSTITQQLIKNITGDDDKRPDRKLREILRALDLEKGSSKDQILEAYLNTINLGRGNKGIQTAARYYFDKDVADLTVTEAACLAGITRNPESNNPATGLERSRERTIAVLEQMHKQGYIGKEEYKQCLEEAKALDSVNKGIIEAPPPQNYYVDMVIEDVIQDIMSDKGWDRERASDKVFSGGLRIYTHMDPVVQGILEEHYTDPKNFPAGKSTAPSGKKDDPAQGQSVQSSMMIMDYQGRIIGVVGGIGEKTGNRIKNRATQVPRQPGSSIKPVSAYAPALEYNKIHYSKSIVDAPVNKNEKGQDWPKNWWGSYYGSISVPTAIERSGNAAAVQLVVNVMSAQFCFDFVTAKLGFTTFVKSERDPETGKIYSDINGSSLGVGGMTHGVTVKEMSAAFASFGNLGKYYKAQSYSRVQTFDGTVLLERGEKNFALAMGEDTSYIMNRLLRLPITGSQGTGRAAAFGGYPIFGKTGTTTDDYDKWFCGGTPYYVGAVWTGFDLNADLAKAGIGDGVSTTTWKKVMEKVHNAKKLAVKEFPTSMKVDYRRYCTSTGLLATDACSSTAWGFYKKSALPSKCTAHAGELLPAGTLPELAATESKTSGSQAPAASSKPAPTPSSKPPVSSAAPSSTAPPPSEPATSGDTTTS